MPPTLLLIIDVILALGVTIRLTRAVTVEDIGDRLLRAPAQRWVERTDPGSVAERKRRWWADALSCPFCVSTWIAIAAFATLVAAHTSDSWFTVLWRIVAAGLTASYILAHVMLVLDVGDDDELEDYDDQQADSATTNT